MNHFDIGSIVLTLSVLLATAHIVGYIFERMRQPRLVGEIIAGLILGPFVLGKTSAPIFQRLFGESNHINPQQIILNFIYWVGLFLLMFLSGSETRRILAKENRRETLWLFGVGTSLPFCIVLGLSYIGAIHLHQLSGPTQNLTSTALILAIAVAVTSIPVISRIFIDLGIIKTRFASLILSFAVLEDIVLWGVLAIATGITATNIGETSLAGTVARHTLTTFAFMLTGLTLLPILLKKIHKTRWNLLIKASPIGYIFFLLFLYTALAHALDVNLVFAAFLAGFGLVGGMSGNQRHLFSSHLESISKVSFGGFIPIYFAMVGYKLTLNSSFSLPLFLEFLFGSSAIVIACFLFAAHLAGFRGLDALNLAITKNARGGPGIVLASVALDAGIINASFYTTLVITAILTSQFAGTWLRYIISKKWPLLSSS